MSPRPHPLGLVWHSEWDGVRERYYDLADEQSAREEAELAEAAANDNDDPDAEPLPPFPRAVMWGALGFLVFVVLLIGALVQ